jgi:hypothetical protein
MENIIYIHSYQESSDPPCRPATYETGGEISFVERFWGILIKMAKLSALAGVFTFFVV